MKQYIRHTLLALLALMALTGCLRDELTFPKVGVVELQIDWSRSALHANSATALIYKDGAYHSTEIFAAYPPRRKLVSLPAGNYSIIVHNEQVDDFRSALAFNNIESFQTMLVDPMDDLLKGRQSTRSYKVSADTMAVGRVMELLITQEMINASMAINAASGGEKIVKSVVFTPRQSFLAVSVVLKVTNGAGYYFAASTPPSINGMASAYWPGTDSYSKDVVSHVLKLAPVPQKVLDPVVTFKGNVLAIGLAGHIVALKGAIQGDYSLTLPFVSGSGLEFREIDLQKQATKFLFTPEDPANPKCNYDCLEIEVSLDLPPLSAMSDMEVGMEDWTNVDVPLDGPQRLYFVANNGTPDSYFHTNTAGVVINMPVATTFTAPVGYRFLQWNTSVDGLGVAYDPGAAYEMRKGTKTIYAIWQKI